MNRMTSFGALFNAYSTHWTGSSFDCPPFTPLAVYRAVRWAITSAVLSADTPTSALRLIPAWQYKSLTCLLAHPLVTRQHCVISFHPPEHLSSILPPMSTPPWPMMFAHICNAPGHVAFCSSHPLIPIPRPEFNYGASLHTFPPPKGFDKASPLALYNRSSLSSLHACIMPTITPAACIGPMPMDPFLPLSRSTPQHFRCTGQPAERATLMAPTWSSQACLVQGLLPT